MTGAPVLLVALARVAFWLTLTLALASTYACWRNRRPR